MPIPTELVGSLPAADEAAGGLRGLRRGQDHFAELQAEQDAAAAGLDQAPRGEPASRSSPTASSASRASPPTRSPTRSPGTGLADHLAGDGQFFAIFDDGHHRQLPRLTGGPFRYKTFASEFVEKNKAIATQAGQAGGDRAVDADAAVPARGRARRLLARAVPRATSATSARRTSASASTRARCASRSTSPRAGSPTRTTRATRGPDKDMLARVHRPQQPRDRPLLARGAQEHRHPHLPRRRLRLGAQQRGSLRASC